MIKSFQADIKTWVEANIKSELDDLYEKQRKGRGGDSEAKRANEIQKKEERLKRIGAIRRFLYNPNGENVGFDSLRHDEVIKMGSYFIRNEPTLQLILVSKYPVLLIDESQDTQRELVDAIMQVYGVYKNRWTVGMFGDTMQRIYTSGKDNLADCIPQEWAFPIKVMNHRSSKRIVDLANAIRSSVDGKRQHWRTDAAKGTVRLFITGLEPDKEAFEKRVSDLMYDATLDSKWKEYGGYKSLILEHHMAANRMNFSDFYTPLKESNEFDESLRNGDIPEIVLLSNLISPLVKAYQAGDYFGISKLLRTKSPLLSKEQFEASTYSQIKVLEDAEAAVKSICGLWDDGAIPCCLDVLKAVKESGVFGINDRINQLLDASYSGDDKKVIALRSALSVSFDELERYAAYITNQTGFATHHGVKGLEFPRVMVILDDYCARGNKLFSYEKLFGAKEKTATDLKNEKEKRDTSINRTKRLFYVACTRAINSLAVVAYSGNPDAVRLTAVSNGWFSPEEIIMLAVNQ